MNVGFHHLDDSCPLALSAAAFLDIAGAGVGMKSPERLCRVFFKGRPDPHDVARKALDWSAKGCRVQIGNEPNLASEGFGGTPEDFARFFQYVRDLAPGVRLYWPGMSPGVPGWQEWAKQAQYVQADGLCVHAYGTFDQMRDVAAFYLETFPGKPLWFGEVNFGAGQQVDRDQWAVNHLAPFLNWCSGFDQIEAVTYFAYRWPTPDMKLPTPVDAAGTAIERVIREWKPTPPKETPMTNPWAGRGILAWNTPADVSEMIAVGKKLGIDYFDLKIANGGSSWAGRKVTKPQVDALKAAGFRVTGWIYDYDDLGGVRFSQGDGVPELEAQALAEAAKALGVDGVTLDLEIETEGHGDLVAIEIAKVRELLPGMPLAAHTWADLHGHDAYPMDVIASSVDVIRPMCYEPVWRAQAMYASLWAFLVGRKVAPVWGATESTVDQLREDRAVPVPDRIECVGESYWEYEAVKNRQDELAALFGGVQPEPPVVNPPQPEPPQPTKPDRHALAAQLRAIADQLDAA